VRPGPSIRLLLLGAHAFVWLVPLAALALLRVYDVYLLRQTEHRLIAESIVIGEAYRDALLRMRGETSDEHRPTPATYLPVEAQVDFSTPVLPPEQAQFPPAPSAREESVLAGRSVEPLLRRAQTFNLSAIRVLDERGYVVASTRPGPSTRMDAQPEVQGALHGRYTAVLRERISDEPPPSYDDVRRRGKVRVFTALPVWSNGKVIAVVRASRTGLDALSSIWANRRGLVWVGLAASLFAIAVSVAFSTAIARPLERLTRAARAVSRGESARVLARDKREPREIGVLHEVLFQMATQLESRATYVQDFASQVSHELKTPITAIRGAAELLSHGLSDMPEPDRARFLANILEDAERMERLVSRLLELARRENERTTTGPDLAVYAHVAKLLARYGERVRIESDGAPETLRIHPEQLDSVLTNLVENALRHHDVSSGQPVRVLLRGEPGARLQIDVIDRGKGVSEANRKRLFERFFTTERDHGGTGLGLAIVKAIAEGRGGSVAARFDAQETTFSVVL